MPRDGTLELLDDVVHDIIAPCVVGGGPGDDDGVVECGDALPRHVLVETGQRRAGEDLEDGGVDVEHAPRGVFGHAPVRRAEEVVHGCGHMTVVEEVADGGVKGGVGLGCAEDASGILDQGHL